MSQLRKSDGSVRLALDTAQIGEIRYTVMSEMSRISTFGLSRTFEGGTWRIDWSQPQVGLMTGFGPTEILGTDWEWLIHSGDRSKCRRMLSEVGVTQDISARIKLEEPLRQSQKMDAFGQLAGGVAHEFNNILTVINSFASLLLNEIPTDELRREYVEQIQQAGERAAALTRQLLTLGGREFTKPRIIDLNAIASRSETMLKRLIGENIVVHTNYYHNLPNIKADPGQIDQVILNLAANARDAMPTGGRMTIGTGICSHNQREAAPGLEELPTGKYVELAVSDTGMGMTEEVKARIFEPFFSTKGVGKGAGLGLSTVYGIVKQNNGAIAVATEPGAGATFRILFPTEQAQAQVVEMSIPAPIAGGSETILLAEDEDLHRQEVYRRIQEEVRSAAMCDACDSETLPAGGERRT